MPKFTCDTNYIIAKNLSAIPDNFYYSDIVLLELIRGANDKTILDSLVLLRQTTKEEGRLITPTDEDWLNASKVLFFIEHDIKKANQGKSPKKLKGETQRMAFDALIAMSARREKITVITDNYTDFQAMRKHYPSIKFITGSEFRKKYP